MILESQTSVVDARAMQISLQRAEVGDTVVRKLFALLLLRGC